MVDIAQAEGFQWDQGNARKNEDKHDVSQPESEQAFFNEPLLMMEDKEHSIVEARFHALGLTDSGRKLHLTFTMRDEGKLIRIISARDMSRKERAYYEQKDA